MRLQGVLDCYTLRLRLPDLDDVPGQDGAPGQDDRPPAAPGPPRRGEPATSTSYHARLTGSDRLALAARFEEYLSPQRLDPGRPTAHSAGRQQRAKTVAITAAAGP